MNHFDDEINIIRHLQWMKRRKIYFVNPTWEVKKFFYSLYKERKFRKWVNSSGKNELPPDFFSEKYRYMLEVMRVDDFVPGNKSPNALESKIVKELDDLLREKGLPPAKESNIQMFIIPDMSKGSKNGYKIYVENFKRIVKKHLDKIDKYRINHPGYKLGFLIFDESPGYWQANEPNVKRKPGERIAGFPHLFVRDKKFIENFLDKDLDFVIWMTPYKNLPENPPFYPEISVFDLKKYEKQKEQLIEYDFEEVVCLEVEG